jgi:CheY-like chemotaxis protein
MNNGIKPRGKKTNRATILVVENNAEHWLIIRAALAQCFPEVQPIWMNYDSQTRSYLATHENDPTKLPRLILLDLYLPRREEGLALLEFIKAHPLYRKLPVIILSDSKSNEDVATAYSFSIASYIIKPITYHDWLDRFYTFRRYWWETVSLPPYKSPLS